MEKFDKELDQLETKLDKWLYVIKNLSKLDRIPEKLKETIFINFFKIAEIAKLNTNEYQEYEASLNTYRDIKNSVDWAHTKGEMAGIEKGRVEGKIEGKIEVAMKLIEIGLDNAKLQEVTGLSVDEIEALRRKR